MEKNSLNSEDTSSAPTIERLLDRDNIAAAWKRVRQNHGAPGPDGMTVEQVEREFATVWQPVEEAIRFGTYAPAGFREVRVPKPSGGERLLRIPCVMDRIVLQATARVLEPVWEPVFSSRSFGYRKGRGPVDGVLAAKAELDQGHIWAVNVDVHKFFDRVDLALLGEEIRAGLEDTGLVSHVLRCVEAGALPSESPKPGIGLPQGSPLSPLLANIALHKFDVFARTEGFSFVRYADDIVVFCQSQFEAEEALSRIATFLHDCLHLEMNPEKSGVAAALEIRFLGFAFRRMLDGKFRACLSPESRDAFRARVIEITEFRPGVSFEQAANETGKFFRQWISYFAYGGAQALVPRESLCGFARVRLRGLMWLEWATEERRIREMVDRGVPEDMARRDAKRKLATAEAARCASLSAAIPNHNFAPYGLADPVPPGRPAPQVNVSKRHQSVPSRQPLEGSRQHSVPTRTSPQHSTTTLSAGGSTLEITLQPNGWLTLRIQIPGKESHHP